jgi:hypothetical protein
MIYLNKSISKEFARAPHLCVIYMIRVIRGDEERERKRIRIEERRNK